MQDCTLLVITVCVLSISALLAILIGFALPRYMVDEEMVGYSATSPEPKAVTQFLKKIDQYRVRGTIKQYPYLVSINRFVYQNVPDSLELTCSGVLLTKDKVLTGKDCLTPELDEGLFREYIVRSDSSYFNRGGILHEIKKVHKTPENISYFAVYILEIIPDASKHVIFPHMALFPSDAPYLTILGFGGYILPRHDVLIEAPFYINTFLPETPNEGIKSAPVKYPKVIRSLLDYDKELIYEKGEYCLKKCVEKSARREQNFITDGRPVAYIRIGGENKNFIFGMRMKGMKSWRSLKEDHISSATYQNFLVYDILFLNWLRDQFGVPYDTMVMQILEGNMTIFHKWMYMEEAQIYIKRYHFEDSDNNITIIPTGPRGEDDD